MKKKFKKGLLGLLLVPTVMMATGCKKDISFSDYLERMGDSATAYYTAINGSSKKRTVEVKTTSDSTYREWVYYGAEDEHGSLEEFKVHSEMTQKFELSLDAAANEALRVTEVTKTTTNGYEENESETDVVATTDVYEETKVTTYILVPGADANPSTGKAYVQRTSKTNSDEPVVVKTVYTYSSVNDLFDAIDNLEDRVESRLVESNFFAGTSFATFALIGEAPEYYKDGKDAFGVRGSMSLTSVDDGSVDKTSGDFDIRYENNLPVSVTLNNETSSKNSHLPQYKQPDMVNMTVTGTSTVTITYSCDLLAGPEGFEEASTAYSAPSISIMSVSVGGIF